MKTIPETYKKDGYTHQLIERDGDIAIYRKARGSTVRFEVVRVMIQKLGWMTNPKDGEVIVFPERERLPVSNEWGKLGWTYHSYERAMEKVQELRASKENTK